MNRKVYVANLPSQATVPEIKDLSPSGNVMSVRLSGTGNRAAKRHCLRGDVYAMGRPEAVSMLNRQDFMGEICGKRARKNGASRKTGVGI